MKNKTKRCEYNNLQQLKDDMDILVNNSKLYNGEEHEVTLQAVKVRNYALMKIEENKIKIIEIKLKLHFNFSKLTFSANIFSKSS